MKKSIFKYQSYKTYLEDSLLCKGKKGTFAKFVGCQPSFISQVLKGKPDLSLEQGLLANDFFEHSAAEAEHFLLLLQFHRAGSKRLRDHFKTQIQASQWATEADSSYCSI